MSDQETELEPRTGTAAVETELSDEEKAKARLKEAISVTKEEIGPLRLKLTITVPQETLDERRGEQFADLKREANIPGFRKGHAPLRLVEKRFATDVAEQLKTQVVSNAFLAAVEKEDLKPLGDPLFWVNVEEERAEDGRTKTIETEKLLGIDQALDHLKMPKQGSLTIACEVELKPQFQLPELTRIPVKKPIITVDDDDVEEEVNRLRMLRGHFEPVEDGEVEIDDMLYADLKMTVDGETIFSEENIDLAARDIRVKNVPLLGFGDAVEGKSAGDSFTFKTPVPDDHENLGIRGKTARFEGTVREIKRLSLPELNKEFLSQIGFENPKDLRATIKSTLESRVDASVREAMRENVGEYLVEKTKLEIPQGLSQRQSERSLARRMVELLQAGMPPAQIEKAIDEMRSKAQDQVIRDLKLYFILEKIAEDRKIDVTEEQINGAIAEIAQRAHKRFDRVRDELSKGDGLMVLYHRLRDQAVLEALLADAEITESESPKKKKPAARKKSPAKKATRKKAAKD